MNSPVKKNKTLVWPNNARIAVVMTCLLENWSDDKGPPFSVQTTALKPGTHDRAAMSWGRCRASQHRRVGGYAENPQRQRRYRHLIWRECPVEWRLRRAPSNRYCGRDTKSRRTPTPRMR